MFKKKTFNFQRKYVKSHFSTFFQEKYVKKREFLGKVCKTSLHFQENM